jgi:hypothetical protein
MISVDHILCMERFLCIYGVFTLKVQRGSHCQVYMQTQHETPYAFSNIRILADTKVLGVRSMTWNRGGRTRSVLNDFVNPGPMDFALSWPQLRVVLASITRDNSPIRAQSRVWHQSLRNTGDHLCLFLNRRTRQTMYLYLSTLFTWSAPIAADWRLRDGRAPRSLRINHCKSPAMGHNPFITSIVPCLANTQELFFEQ